MYSESDLEAAVAGGVLAPQAAEAFRNFVASSRATATADEESFRLLTGFNDIFVAIATIAVLIGVSWLSVSVNVLLGGPAVAATSWGLAEYFTRKRRMALPSILLLLSFIGGVVATLLFALDFFHNIGHDNPQVLSGILTGIAAITALAAWLHWKRFMVPITVAAGAVAVAVTALMLATTLVPAAQRVIFVLILATGIALFALAMRWDMSDRLRHTRRADVAFWLHLAAAPMIAHPLFQLLGVFNAPEIGIGKAVTVLALYVVFALVALAVDRRALLVSGLAYVLYALNTLFTTAGAVELGMALTVLVIGSALLLLSAFWHPVRVRVVGLLGSDLANRLPPVA